MAEATELADACGLDRQLVLKTIAGSGFASPVMAFKSRRLASRSVRQTGLPATADGEKTSCSLPSRQQQSA
ncbi:hypothetical protein LT493_00765 [Streptomyces tricolor]|nr:hypothetical protein [Streptomyces tricolor]